MPDGGHSTSGTDRNGVVVIDLYSGRGGVGHALDALGFEHVGVDIEDYADDYPGDFVQGDASDVLADRRVLGRDQAAQRDASAEMREVVVPPPGAVAPPAIEGECQRAGDGGEQGGLVGAIKHDSDVPCGLLGEGPDALDGFGERRS